MAAKLEHESVDATVVASVAQYEFVDKEEQGAESPGKEKAKSVGSPIKEKSKEVKTVKKDENKKDVKGSPKEEKSKEGKKATAGDLPKKEDAKPESPGKGDSSSSGSAWLLRRKAEAVWADSPCG